MMLSSYCRFFKTENGSRWRFTRGRSIRQVSFSVEHAFPLLSCLFLLSFFPSSLSFVPFPSIFFPFISSFLLILFCLSVCPYVCRSVLLSVFLALSFFFSSWWAQSRHTHARSPRPLFTIEMSINPIQFRLKIFPYICVCVCDTFTLNDVTVQSSNWYNR